MVTIEDARKVGVVQSWWFLFRYASPFVGPGSFSSIHWMYPRPLCMHHSGGAMWQSSCLCHAHQKMIRANCLNLKRYLPYLQLVRTQVAQKMEEKNWLIFGAADHNLRIEMSTFIPIHEAWYGYPWTQVSFPIAYGWGLEMFSAQRRNGLANMYWMYLI